MARQRSLASRWCAARAILALFMLALVQYQYPAALLATVWRVFVISWDNPATQVAEEMVSAEAPAADPNRPLRDRIIAANLSRQYLRVPADPRGHESFARSHQVTRAPPAA
jgi:hypothetical protein